VVLVWRLPHLYYVINIKDEKYLRDFGKNFRKLRLAKNMSQEALGNEAGIGKNQVGLIERGEINVTICTIKKIAKNLGYEPKDFLDF
jgi:transcriptional regulator with XRE-family HTH domain